MSQDPIIAEDIKMSCANDTLYEFKKPYSMPIIKNATVPFSLIFARGESGEFGNHAELPWPRIKEDMIHFKNITTNGDNNIIIMGRLTFESLGMTCLTGRRTMVVSSILSQATPGTNAPFYTVPTLATAFLKCLQIRQKNTKIFVIGGLGLIYQSLEQYSEWIETIYTTIVIPTNLWHLTANLCIDYNRIALYMNRQQWIEDLKSVESPTCKHPFQIQRLDFITYTQSRPTHPEHQYLALLRQTLQQGIIKNDRTLTGTISYFAPSLRFDVSGDFPLYTTKDVFFRGAVEELLFFISGKTDTGLLSQKGVKIWEGNTSRKYLDDHGFTNYKVGEAGPIYGFQWRHFGAEYIPNQQLELGQGGIDQLQELIDGIKAVRENPSDPHGRRLVLSAWNPVDLNKMVLPPCHYSCVFSVNNYRLDCMVTMRSNDAFLGNSFNVASYALLIRMISQITGIFPGQLVLILGDFHIYNNHINQVREQLTRNPRPLPKLDFSRQHKSIDDFTADSFILRDYHPHPTIMGKMAV